MELSGIRDALRVSCSVVEPNCDRKRELLEQLGRFGVKPNIAGEKIEFEYFGGRDVVSKLVAYVEDHAKHSVHTVDGS